MENKPGARREPQIFLLSEKSFGELQRVQITLHLMGRIARGDANEEDSTMVTTSREELYRVFFQLSQDISDALDQVWNDHWGVDNYQARQ